MVKRVVHKNIVLLIVAVAQFMVVLDSSIVNVALPSIYKSLHFTSTDSLQWVVTAYTLTFGGFLLLGGRTADLFGRKKSFLAAVSLFGAASLLTGLSQNAFMIDVLRALQGLIAAFMSPAALSIVLTTFTGEKERAGALSVWGAVAAGGAAAGVLFGGLLTQYLDWRWNFFVNVPIAIAVAVAAYRYVPESTAGLDHKKLDIPGALLVTAGLIVMVFAFSKGPSYGWGSAKTLGMLAGSLVLLAAFIFNETRSRHPLMPLSIFRIRNIAAANVTQLPIIAAMFSMFFFVTLYTQNILGYSPVVAGLSFLPVTFVIGGVAASMQKIVGKIGYKKPLVAAPLLIAGGLFWLAHLPVAGHYWTNILPGLALTAAGAGMSFVTITIAATAGVPARESGLASGLLTTSQQIGGSLGLAILTGISSSVATSYAMEHARMLSRQALAVTAQVTGFHHALYIGMCFAIAGSLVSLLFIREKAADVENAEGAVAAG